MKKKIKTGTLSELMSICQNYIDDTISEEKFYEALSRIDVKKYMPLYEKQMHIGLALSDMENLEIQIGLEPECAIDLEKIHFFRFLLAYTNLEDDLFIPNADVIDMLNITGVVDYFLNICERDYNAIIRMFNVAIEFKDMFAKNALLESIDNEQAKENIVKVTKVFEDKKMVENVAKLVEMNDPALIDLKKTIHSMEIK